MNNLNFISKYQDDKLLESLIKKW